MKTEELISSIAFERRKIFELAKSLNENESKRTGVHPKFGKLSIKEWMEFFLLHEAHHLITIFKLKNDVEIRL